MTLVRLMKFYLEAKPGRSVAQLARRCDIGETTLRRILQNEAKVSFVTALSILSQIADRKTTNEVLEEMFPGEMALFKKQFELGAQMDLSTSKVLDAFLVEDPHCYIIHLCASTCGTTLKNIVQNFGSPGEKALNAMVDVGLIEQRGGAYYLYPTVDFNITNPSVAKTVSVKLAQRFNTENIGSDAALLAQSSGNVNLEGLRAIKNSLRRAALEIEEIRKKPEYEGEFKYYSSTIMNLMDSEESLPPGRHTNSEEFLMQENLTEGTSV